MSGRVTIRLPARSGGRRGPAVGADVAPGAPGPAPSSAPARIPRVARVLALAHHWRRLIHSGAVRDQADIARLVGVSRGRVTQVMCLLWLAPDIQEAMLLSGDGAIGDAPLERQLRCVAAHPEWMNQRQVLRRFVK